MDLIKYRDKNLYFENVSVKTIAQKNTTPFFLYSFKQLENNFRFFQNTFNKINPLICFSIKSNTNLIILRKLKKLGSGADVVSIGELQLALKAGIDPQKIVFSGVGKTKEEFLKNEINEIIKIAKNKKVTVKIGIRLNPNITGKTNKKISTGNKSDKFGVSLDVCFNILKQNNHNKNISIEGLSVHIGSQIKELAPFQKTLKVVDKFLIKLKNNGINISFLDLGGGMGIPYSKSDKKFDLKKYANLVHTFNQNHNCNIIFEPGRYMSANIAVLVSKITYIKKIQDRNFIILDAAMNDLMRPALYGAKHDVLPIQKNRDKFEKKTEFVGPICESTDKFITYNNYSKMKEGEYVCFTNVGAYGRSLSSNYNVRPLAAEIAINKKSYTVIRPRQKLKDLIK